MPPILPIPLIRVSLQKTTRPLGRLSSGDETLVLLSGFDPLWEDLLVEPCLLLA